MEFETTIFRNVQKLVLIGFAKKMLMARKLCGLISIQHLPTLGSKGYFFLIDTDGLRRSRVQEALRGEPYQTVSTICFILGILRTDL